MTVIRSRLRSTTVDPAIEPPSEPPPNMSESPPPRPACSRIRTISVNDTTMWKIRTIGVSTCVFAPFKTARTLTGIVGEFRVDPKPTVTLTFGDGSVGKADDPREILGVERRAADERAVDARAAP